MAETQGLKTPRLLREEIPLWKLREPFGKKKLNWLSSAVTKDKREISGTFSLATPQEKLFINFSCGSLPYKWFKVLQDSRASYH